MVKVLLSLWRNQFKMAGAGGALVSSTSSVDPDGLIISHNQTIGKYTTPVSAVASSEGIDGKGDPEPFDNSDNWTLTGATISAGVFNAVDYGANVTPRGIAPLGANLGNANFEIDFDFKYTTTNTSNDSHLIFGVSDHDDVRNTGGTGDAIFVLHNDSTNKIKIYSKTDSNTVIDSGVGDNALSDNTQYYGRLKRTNNNVDFIVYSDSARTIQVSITSHTITSSLNSLDRFVLAGGESTVGATKLSTVTIDNITGAEIGVIIPTANVIDDNTNTNLKTNLELNPNVYVSGGSDKLLSHIAIYPHSDTTCTGLKIQYATASAPTTWIDIRVFPYSILTEGAWNYVRFNVVYGQYIRIYCTDGSAKVLSISELKYLTHTDDDLNRTHGHVPIDATNSLLGVDGI